MAVERFFTALYFVLGIFLPLITVNCAILGASLFLIIRKYTLWQSVAYGAGSGIGWMLAIIAMGGLRRNLIFCDPPENFGASGITAILAGIMALAFIGFTGIASL